MSISEIFICVRVRCSRYPHSHGASNRKERLIHYYLALGNFLRPLLALMTCHILFYRAQ